MLSLGKSIVFCESWYTLCTNGYMQNKDDILIKNIFCKKLENIRFKMYNLKKTETPNPSSFPFIDHSASRQRIALVS